MIRKFLGLFSYVRDLEAQRDSAMANVCESLQKESARAERLEDRLTAAQEDRQRLWALVKDALSGERTAYQAHINVEWQKQGRSAPYPDAPQIPAHRVPQEVPNEIVSRPLLPSERMARGTSDFIKQFAGKISR